LKSKPKRKKKYIPRSRPNRPAGAEPAVTLAKADSYFIGRFSAMASPCEILMETDDAKLAMKLLRIAAREAFRIERKYSRYVSGNIIDKINNANGERVKVDDETALLIDFANSCFELSEGLFDVTSGVLRKAWKFDGSSNLPEQVLIDSILPNVGWGKVTWEKPYFSMPAGMELDFGGIGKEYAVDRTVLLLREAKKIALLVNFGGDIYTGGEKRDGKPWLVGIEDPSGGEKASKVLEITNGALATSGDTKRYLLKDGKRLGHILNPLTGWPVEDAPSSVTVADDTCTNAGILATLAMLHGANAEEFLEEQGVRFWCVR